MTPAPTRRSELSGLRVVVSPRAPKDVAVVSPVGGERTLVLREGQTRENATDRLLERFPNEHLDDVRRFVRTHLPNAPSFESILQTGPPPEWMTPPTEHAPKVKSSRTTKLASAAAASLLTTATLAGYALVRDMSDSLLDQPEFQSFSRAAGLECEILDRNSATCTNRHLGTSWKVTATEAEDEHEPNHYRFVSGDKLAIVQIFSSALNRTDYPVNAAYDRLWPFRTGRDRVAISATDAPVIAALAGAADRSVLRGNSRNDPDVKGKSASRSATPSRRPSTVPGIPQPSRTPGIVEPWPTDGATQMLMGATTPKPAKVPQEPQEPGSAPEPATDAQTGTPAPDGPADAPMDPPASTATETGGSTVGGGSQDRGAVVQLPGVSLSIDLGI